MLEDDLHHLWRLAGNSGHQDRIAEPVFDILPVLVFLIQKFLGQRDYPEITEYVGEWTFRGRVAVL